jgi:DNA-directed RNA polymerase I subunit RPA1
VCQQTLYGTLPADLEDVLTVPPCILKPRQLWSGKQLVRARPVYVRGSRASAYPRAVYGCVGTQITTVLLNLTRGLHPLTMTSGARIPARAWEGGAGGPAAEESIVVFCEGELVQGALDKNQFGATAYGLVHVRGCVL